MDYKNNYQGNLFINNIKNREKTILGNNIIENFSSNILDPGQQVLKKKDNIGGPVVKKNLDDFTELKNLKIEYFRNLQNYNALYDNLMNDTKLYLESVSSNNKNKFKEGSFDNGQKGFITNRGVFKMFQNQDSIENTIGKNNCPKDESNNLGNDFENSLLGGFIKIPNSNPLIKGTPMISGQSCGNEGQNVYVSMSSKTSPAEYLGCYNPSVMKMQTDITNVTHDQCAQRAEDLGENFFALSNNNNGVGSCYIGGSESSIKNGGYAFNTEEVWSIESEQLDRPRSGYGILSNKGVFSVFVGGKGEVWKSGSDGPEDNYSLVLQTDGNLVIYNSARAATWATNTNGKIGDVNTAPSGKEDTVYPGNEFNDLVSKNRNCYLSIDYKETNDENNNLKRFINIGLYNRKWKCEKIENSLNNKTKNTWIGFQDNAQSVYKTTNANRSGVAKVAHISDDSKLSNYPNNLISFPSDYLSVKNFDKQFQYIQGYDSVGNDLGSFQGSIEKAKKDCVSRSDCAGFAYRDGTYWLKNKQMFPKGLRQPNSSTGIYIRKPSVNNHYSCGKKVDFINNDRYLNYPKKGKDMSLDTLCGLGIISNDYKKDIKQSYKTLLLTLDKLKKKINELTKENIVLNKHLMKEYKKMMQSIKKYEEIYIDIKKEKNVDSDVSAMNEDSDIQMLTESYYYMMWSILAIILIFGTMKTLKK